MKEIVKKFNDVAFVWTYECNTDCEYCFSFKYIKPYKGIAMSFENYKFVLDTIIKNWVNSISFIGWEPALWNNINKAISYAKNLWIKTTVFSNSMICLKELPDVFYIHLNVLFFLKNKNIIKNLYEYSKNSKIIFIYNVYNSNKYSLNLLIKILKSFKFDFAISFNIAFNINMDKNYWNFIYNAYRIIAEEMGKNVLSSWPLPHCIFTAEQICYLQQKSILDNSYWPPWFDNTDVFFPVVNPDTKTLLPCAPINLEINSSYLLEWKYDDYKSYYSKKFEKFIYKKNNFCWNCDKFNKDCQYWGLINLYSF